MDKGKILIIEDEPDLLRAYSRIIGGEGYEVLAAAEPDEGLRICRRERPDLVLLDTILPEGVSGVDVCRRIKTDGDLAGSFVLMISGLKTTPENLAEGLEAGADGYLTKPVEPKLLLAQIRALLRIKKAERDLSESHERYRQLAEQLRATNYRLEEYNRLKAEFIANMSHELRTPLTAIIGFAQLIQLKPPAQPVPRECSVAFERILRNGKHLLSLIDEVLDIAKIEAGRMKIHREHFDVSELAEGAFQELQALAQQKGLQYRLTISGQVPLAFSDPLRVRQVMINLLSNAIKFTSQGAVEVALEPDGADLFRFVVRDTGIGIREEAVEVIFERFRQVDGTLTRVAGGTGLGLSIVKQIVSLLGGEIEVSSTPGQGSVFTVTLPLVAQETPGAAPGLQQPVSAAAAAVSPGSPSDNGDGSAAPPPVSAAAAAGGLPAEENGKPLVLIVEDEEDMANLLSETISRANYRARVASSGAEGLQIAREEKEVAAIILDVMMPGMDGWKVLQALKSEPHTAQIPVIVCSIVDNRALGYKLGASNYLIKPVGPEQLISALEGVGTPGSSGGDGSAEDSAYILVVDDEHGIRELLVSALKKAGFNARSASSGETALKMISQSPPRAILSDLMMPGGMSGYEFIARMRSSAETERIPIIVVTGKDMTAGDRRFIIGEIANVIRKGDLLMSDLETRLRQTLEEIGVNPTSGKNTVS